MKRDFKAPNFLELKLQGHILRRRMHKTLQGLKALEAESEAIYSNTPEKNATSNKPPHAK